MRAEYGIFAALVKAFLPRHDPRQDLCRRYICRMSENTYKPTETELLAAAESAKSNVAASLGKAMGAMSQRGLFCACAKFDYRNP